MLLLLPFIVLVAIYFTGSSLRLGCRLMSRMVRALLKMPA